MFSVLFLARHRSCLPLLWLVLRLQRLRVPRFVRRARAVFIRVSVRLFGVRGPAMVQQLAFLAALWAVVMLSLVGF